MSGASGSRSSGVIGRTVGHHLHEVFSITKASTLHEHMWRRGKRARKAQGGGKRNLHLVFRGRWISTQGPSHTPFGGVRRLWAEDGGWSRTWPQTTDRRNTQYTGARGAVKYKYCAHGQLSAANCQLSTAAEAPYIL
eukprot:scaffold714_cov121-Isochrysis_galbana.AAC.3